MKYVRTAAVVLVAVTTSFVARAQAPGPTKDEVAESKSRLRSKVKPTARNRTLPFGLEMGMSYADAAARLGLKAKGFKDGTHKLKPRARYLGRKWFECELGFDANTLYVFTCRSNLPDKEWRAFDPDAFEHMLWEQGPSPTERLHAFPSTKWRETVDADPSLYLDLFRKGYVGRYLWFGEGSLEYDYQYTYSRRGRQKKRVITMYFCNTAYEGGNLNYFCHMPTTDNVTTNILDRGSYVIENL